MFEQIQAMARAGEKRELMPHLKAIVFVRPTQEVLELLVQELRDPKFGEYYIFFSNAISDRDIERLAEADEQEVVKDVQEMYADYFALGPSLFSLNRPSTLVRSPSAYQEMLTRCTDGVCALLMSLRRQPMQVRYSCNSKLAKDLASEVKYRVAQDPALFDFPSRDQSQPLLLILDRADDPITPLLTQWTYRAMIHELIGINNHRVMIKKLPGKGAPENDKDKKKESELILSVSQDPFYRENMNKNFGELGIALKHLVAEFKNKTKSNENIDSLEGIRRFLQDYPQFRKMSTNVSKHVTLMTQLSSVVDQRSLMEVSAREQELACKDSHAAHLKMMEEVIEARGVHPMDKVRLAMLYALRYEDHKQEDTKRILRLLLDAGVNAQDVGLVAAVIAYGGKKCRTGELFSSVWGKEGLSLDRIRKFAAEAIKGVENIYTQHKPFLFEIINDVLSPQGKLRQDYYPFMVGQATRDPPKHLIIFIMGGATYEEAMVVQEFNAASDKKGGVYMNPSRTKIVLGGNYIHNSASFIDELRKVSL